MPYFLFAVIVIVIEFAREGTLCELLYAVDVALMSEMIDGLRNKFLESKETFESKGF